MMCNVWKDPITLFLLPCRGSYDEDPPYAMVNHDTASNYSRPSRVKRYQDTDSELSGLTGRSDYLYGMHTPTYYLWHMQIAHKS